MKKAILLVLLALMPIMLLAQNYQFPVNENGNEEFKEVVNTGIKKDMMFSNAQEWIAKTFGDYKKVIQFENKEDGKLIIKGFSPINHVRKLDNLSERMSYTITIDIKDDKYRYTISDIVIVQSVYAGPLGKIGELEKKHGEHVANIEKYKNGVDKYKLRCDSLQSIDIDNLKKKQIQDLNGNISDCKKGIVYNQGLLDSEEIFYKEEYDVIQSLIFSLKSKMSVNDDF